MPPEERALWDERLGRTRVPGGVDAWIHAASMGEATAVGPLVRELSRVVPPPRFALTSMTRGGRERLAGLGPPARLAPLDSPQSARRFFAGVAPRRLFLLETELWPQWLLRARDLRVPVVVLSARLSERSLAGYGRLGAPFRSLVAGLAGVFCQSDADLGRWRELGARTEASVVAGNLKDDGLPSAAPDRAAARAALGLEPGRPLLVLGSVRPGEVSVLARAWRRLPPALRERWQVVAVPRHPQASTSLREEAARSGQAISRDGTAPGGNWRWEDGLGVLNAFYAAADVAFVGGSLGPYGGHNPLEPAACGAAVLMGPYHASQGDVVPALESAGALRVVASEAELANDLGRWLSDDTARAAAGRAALAVAERRRGATARTVAQMVERGLWPAA